MTSTSNVKIDLASRGVPPVVHAMQDDKYSRIIEISLYEHGLKWTPPSDATAIIRYSKPDGTVGNYDFLPNGNIAYRILENKLMITLSPQVCTVPGIVELAVSIIEGESEINTFAIDIDVEKNPGFSSASEDYNFIKGYLFNSGWPPNKNIATDANGNVIAKNETVVGSFESYELDLSQYVTIKLPGTYQVEQQFDITDNVSLDGLRAAIDAGKSVKVLCRAEADIWATSSHEICVTLNQEIRSDGNRMLSNIGLDPLYPVADIFECHFFRLYVYETEAVFSFTPAALNYQLNQMVRSVNGTAPDAAGNVDVPKATAEEVIAAMPMVTAVTVTESTDGTVTMTNTFEDGSTETVVVSPDESGNPAKLTINGTEIPITWTEATA